MKGAMKGSGKQAGQQAQRFIAYYRVSTQKQGQSGLGLEAQQQAVHQYLNGKDLIAEFVEVESGKRTDRPKLADAIAACRIHDAKLIIAKLDRLARNVHFVSGLKESGVWFQAVDFPDANNLTIHILAAVAEHEAEMVSMRTRAALAAVKARYEANGKQEKLGRKRGQSGSEMECKFVADLVKARQVRSAKAVARANELAPVIAELQTVGCVSLRAIARGLDRRGYRPPRGGKWSASQVRTAMARF